MDRDSHILEAPEQEGQEFGDDAIHASNGIEEATKSSKHRGDANAVAAVTEPLFGCPSRSVGIVRQEREKSVSLVVSGNNCVG
jgi:hypothetical protein